MNFQFNVRLAQKHRVRLVDVEAVYGARAGGRKIPSRQELDDAVRDAIGLGQIDQMPEGKCGCGRTLHATEFGCPVGKNYMKRQKLRSRSL